MQQGLRSLEWPFVKLKSMDHVSFSQTLRKSCKYDSKRYKHGRKICKYHACSFCVKLRKSCEHSSIICECHVWRFFYMLAAFVQHRAKAASRVAKYASAMLAAFAWCHPKASATVENSTKILATAKVIMLAPFSPILAPFAVALIALEGRHVAKKLQAE